MRKAKNAQSNTFAEYMDGITAKGRSGKIHRVKVKAVFTSDEHGESLSLYCPSNDTMILVPFEQVERLIEHTRKERK